MQNWRTTTVMQLCQGMRETGDYFTLPILADALQDAGCTDEEMLRELRKPPQDCQAAQRLIALIYSEETAAAVRTVERLAAEMGPRAFCEEGDAYGEECSVDYGRLMRVGDRWTEKSGEDDGGWDGWGGTVEHGSEGLRDGDLSSEWFGTFWQAYQTLTGRHGAGNPFGCTC
jgi:hypothetical protein